MDSLKKAIKEVIPTLCWPPSKCHLPRPKVDEKQSKMTEKKK